MSEESLPVRNVQPEAVLPQIQPIEEEPAIPDHLSSCVLHIKTLIPDLPNLDAIDFPINTITPKVGDIIKFQYYNATTTKYTYHIAIITEITEEEYKINEANYEKNKETNRIVKKTDEHILGFFDMDRQRLIDELTPIQKQTLWNESGWSQYTPKRAVLRGKDGEWGVGQFMPSTWKWLSQLRQTEKLRMLDKMNFEDQIEMFKYGWEKGIVWYGRPQ